MTFRELGNHLLFWLGFPSATWYGHHQMALGWIPALLFALLAAIVLILTVNVVLDLASRGRPPQP